MTNITNATVKSIIKNSGATINKNGNRVIMKTGYQVSKEDLIVVSLNEFGKDILKSLIQKLSRRGEYLGVWIDNGRVYIDISYRASTKKQAMDAGRELNQLSVLRWRDGKCLAVV